MLGVCRSETRTECFKKINKKKKIGGDPNKMECAVQQQHLTQRCSAEHGITLKPAGFEWILVQCELTLTQSPSLAVPELQLCWGVGCLLSSCHEGDSRAFSLTEKQGAHGRAVENGWCVSVQTYCPPVAAKEHP